MSEDAIPRSPESSGSSPASTPRGGLLPNLLLLAGSLFVFFALLEVVLRVAAPIQKVVWGPEQARGNLGEYDSLLGWKSTPGARGFIETSEFRTAVAINEHGNRDPEMLAENADGRFRIAFLGDSFTWGYGVDDTATFVSRLRPLLPGVETINLGMVGYGTDQALLRWRNVAALWKPNLVVIQFTHNDVGNNATPADRDFPKPQFLLEADTLRLTNVPVPRKEEWLTHFVVEPSPPPKVTATGARRVVGVAKSTLRRLRTYQFAQKLYSDLLVRFEVRRPSYFAETYPPWIENEWKVTYALYDRLIAEIRATGATVAVVAAPIRLQLRYASWTRPHDLIDAFCRSRNVPFLDLLPTLRSIENGEDLYFPKDGHWNADGHSIVAQSIAEFLKEERLIP